MTNLIHTIQQAFSGVTLGNGIGLSEGNAIDDYAPAEERARCRKQDEQTHWHKIPVELLNQYYVANGFAHLACDSGCVLRLRHNHP